MSILAAAADSRQEYHSLASLYLPIGLAVFVLVTLALAVPIVRDRASRGKQPSPRLSSGRLELGYALVLALVAALLGWKSLEAIAAVRPVGDVAHALWIPKARTKYDAYPGYVNVFDLRFAPGIRYDEDRCSEFCGTYHTDMVFDVRTLPPSQFSAWLRDARRRAVASGGEA